jgi:hypothetical protein
VSATTSAALAERLAPPQKRTTTDGPSVSGAGAVLLFLPAPEFAHQNSRTWSAADSSVGNEVRTRSAAEHRPAPRLPVRVGFDEVSALAAAKAGSPQVPTGKRLQLSYILILLPR